MSRKSCLCVGFAEWVMPDGTPTPWPTRHSEGAHFTSGRRGPGGGYCGACNGYIPAGAGSRDFTADTVQPASGPTDWRDRPLDPRDVLAFIHEFTGQENEAAEVRDFVQLAAACVEEGRSYRDLDATGCAEGFVDWCADQLRAGGFDETEVAGRGK